MCVWGANLEQTNDLFRRQSSLTSLVEKRGLGLRPLDSASAPRSVLGSQSPGPVAALVQYVSPPGSTLTPCTLSWLQEWRGFVERLSAAVQQQLTESGVASLADLTPPERSLLIEKAATSIEGGEGKRVKGGEGMREVRGGGW